MVSLNTETPVRRVSDKMKLLNHRHAWRACALAVVVIPYLAAPGAAQGARSRAAGFRPSGTTALPAGKGSRYTVRFDEGDRRSVVVDASISERDSLLTMYEGNYDASHLPEGWTTFVRDLEVRDAAGAKLTLRKAGLNSWRVPASARWPLKLHYIVLVHHDQGHWPTGWNEAAYARRDCDCIVLTSMALFIGTARMGETSIALSLPPALNSTQGAWLCAPRNSWDVTRTDLFHDGRTRALGAVGPLPRFVQPQPAVGEPLGTRDASP